MSILSNNGLGFGFCPLLIVSRGGLESSSNFDVAMGSFDGAETCELVGSYLLSHLPTAYRNDIGLYHDDGFSAFNISPREIEKINKEICKVFNDNKLKLTIEANKNASIFLTSLLTSGPAPSNRTRSQAMSLSTSTCKATILHPFYVESLKLLTNAFQKFHPTSNRSTQALAHIKKL